MPRMKFILHTDGASKGNPGTAGIGVAFWRDGEAEPFHTLAERLPDTTNNAAEYTALLRGLQEALLKGASEVEVRTDSELMAKQIAGLYAVKSPDLQPQRGSREQDFWSRERGRATATRPGPRTNDGGRVGVSRTARPSPWRSSH